MKQTNHNLTDSPGSEKASAQNQDALVQDLEGLLLILEALPDAYLILSPDLRIQLVTAAYLESTHSNKSDLLYKFIFDTLPASLTSPDSDLVKNLSDSLHQVLKTKKLHQINIQHCTLPIPAHKGGGFEDKYWSAVNIPVLNSSGDISYIIHKETKVTELLLSQVKVEHLKAEHYLLQATLEELKSSQEKLKNEQRRLKEAQTLGHIGSFEAIYPYKDIYWSDELYRIHGLRPQSIALSANKLSTFIHPNDKAFYDAAMKAFYEKRKNVDLTCRIIRKDGEIRILHTKVKTIRDKNKKELKVYGTVQDITDQVRAQQKLYKSEALMRDAELAGHIGSYEVNIATEVLKFSEGMFRLIGYKPNAFVPTLDLIDEASHPEDVQTVRLILEQAAQTKQAYEYFRRVYWPNGEMHHLHSRGKVICDKQGNAVKFAGITQDITSLKKLEEENLKLKLLQQKELLMTILHTQETERSHIAEGLHNGIGQILYATKMSIDQLFPGNGISPTSPDFRKSLDKASRLLGQAIYQTRNLSHQLSPTMLEDLGLEAALKQVCTSYQHSDLKFRCWVFNLQDQLDNHMQIAVYRMAQELANNIARHADATEASLLLRKQKNYLLLQAEDNGKGFDEKLIQPKGIGLKSIQDRVKLLNGSITIESEPEKGTLIQIFLPLQH